MNCRATTFAALGLCIALVARAEEPPNILLILVDDLRADVFGHTDHAFFESPNVDRLAAEGVRFADAFVITSLCSPSRATILSGSYTHEHGVEGIWQVLADSTRLVVEDLQDAGYETAWIGKWHLALDDAPARGFDHWLSFRGQGSYADPRINVDGVVRRAKGHMTDVLTQDAIDFLQSPRESPFFLGLSHRAVHAPYLAQHRHHGRFDRVEMQLPESAAAERDDQPGFLECRATDLDRYEEIARGYFELLAGVDESVGRVLDTLAATGQLDHTLVIFTSDNGYLLGEHGLSDKRVAYEESIRIPLILRYPPWFAPGSVVRDDLALNLDIAPTLRDAAGLSADPAHRGVSLRAQSDGTWRRERFLYLYAQEQNPDNPRAACTPTLLALRTLREKLVIYPFAEEPSEYYRLDEDPRELRNLAVVPAESTRVRELAAQLASLADSLGVDRWRR